MLRPRIRRRVGRLPVAAGEEGGWSLSARDRAGGPIRPPEIEAVPPEYHRQIILRFDEAQAMAHRAGRAGLEAEAAALIDELESELGRLDFRPLYGLVREPQRVHHHWFALRVPEAEDLEGIARYLQAKLGVVAFVEGWPAFPPAPIDPLLVDQPNMTLSAPQAMGIKDAWDAGVRGDGVSYADIEWGWLLCHEDLPRARGLPKVRIVEPSFNYLYPSHGTGVLGLLSGVWNNAYGAGAAPEAEGMVVGVCQLKVGASYDRGQGPGFPGGVEGAFHSDTGFDGPLEYNIAQAIHMAAERLQPGDVILLEAQRNLPVNYSGERVIQTLPVEAEPQIRAAIRYATTDRQLIVIEAAGNGNVDLDTIHDPVEGAFMASRKPNDAILVGAALMDTMETWTSRTEGSNYGHGVEVFASGAEVTTLGDPQRPYDPKAWTRYFSGTSSASALVAGAAILLQSAAKAKGGLLDQEAMRKALTKEGTPTSAGHPIGVMPSLTAHFAPAAAPSFEVGTAPNLAKNGPDVRLFDAATGDVIGDPEDVVSLAGGANYEAEITVHNQGGAEGDCDVELSIGAAAGAAAGVSEHSSVSGTVLGVPAGQEKTIKLAFAAPDGPTEGTLVIRVSPAGEAPIPPPLPGLSRAALLAWGQQHSTGAVAFITLLPSP